jgi:hypothetical protein
MPLPSSGCGAEPDELGTAPPCPRFDHAFATCEGFECALGACHAGWADCDDAAANGCETRLSTTSDCGACGRACDAGEVCGPTGCTASCAPPGTSCGGGCFELSSDPTACGGCERVCPVGSVSAPDLGPECATGECDLGCAPDHAECDGIEPAVGRTDPVCVPADDPEATCASCPRTIVTDGLASCTSTGIVVHCGAGGVACDASGRLACTSTRSSDAHCGACGVPCDGECIEGVCEPVGTSTILALAGARWLALDATHVYASTASEVHRVAKTGGDVETLATDQAEPSGLVVVGGRVYWANRLGGAVVSVPASGGAQPMNHASAVTPRVLAADAEHVYYADDRQLRRLNVATGASEPVSGVSWRFDSADPRMALAVDDESYYWADATSDAFRPDVALYAAPIAGGVPRVLATRAGGDGDIQARSTSLLAADGDVYWVHHAAMADDFERLWISQIDPRARYRTASVSIVEVRSATVVPSGIARTPDGLLVSSGHQLWTISLCDWLPVRLLSGAVDSREVWAIAADDTGWARAEADGIRRLSF